MAIVPDIHDSQGMFSKAGRFTSEKYIVFQKKDEILYNKQRYAKTSIMPDIPNQNKNQPNSKNPLGNEEQEHLLKNQSNSETALKLIKKNEVQPFSRQTTRDKVQKINIDKNQPPPCGYYHPKYSEIDTHVLQNFDYNITLKKNQAKIQIPEPILTQEELKRQIPDRMRYSNTCLYEMSRQVSRGDTLFKGAPDVHENRFETIPTTTAWSKVPRTPSVPMGSILARDQMIIYKKKGYAPDYQPKFEFGRRGLGSCGAKFEKLSHRGELFPVTTHYTNEHIFEYDQYCRKPKSTLFHTQVTPTFDKMLHRETEPDSKLPSFMQKNVNMRLTLCTPHQKMLESNNFKDSRFQTMTSSFTNLHKKKNLKTKTQSYQEEFDLYQNDQEGQ